MKFNSIVVKLGLGVGRFCPNSTHIVCVLGLLLSQPGNAQHFGGFQERAQRPLVDIHLAVVDELDQRM